MDNQTLCFVFVLYLMSVFCILNALHNFMPTIIFFNINMTEIERDDLLLDQVLQSRRSSLDQQKASRQSFILVASLIDRIPNLAGLARTCEVSYSCFFVSQSFLCFPIFSILLFFIFLYLSKQNSLLLLMQVFKASGLAIADTNIINDKQFQLIRFS